MQHIVNLIRAERNKEERLGKRPLARDLRIEALAYRIWCYCQAERWNTSAAAVAEALEETKQTVARIMSNRDWTRRLAYNSEDYRQERAKLSPGQELTQEARHVIRRTLEETQLRTGFKLDGE